MLREKKNPPRHHTGSDTERLHISLLFFPFLTDLVKVSLATKSETSMDVSWITVGFLRLPAAAVCVCVCVCVCVPLSDIFLSAVQVTSSLSQWPVCYDGQTAKGNNLVEVVFQNVTFVPPLPRPCYI